MDTNMEPTMQRRKTMSNWRDFWEWLHCKAEELDVLVIGDREQPLKSFDVQVWLCEMEELYHTMEEKAND